MGLGQLLLSIGNPGTGRVVGIAALLLSLAAVPISLMRAPSPQLPKLERLGPRRLYQISPLGVVLTAASGLVMGSLYGVAPVFAKAAGLSLKEISLFMAGLMLGGFLLQFPIGRLSDRFDRRLMIAVLALALALISGLMTQFIAPHGAVLIFAAIVLGGVSFTLYPLAVAHVNDFITTDTMLAASAGILLIYSIGAAVGPILSAEFLSLWGPTAFLIYFVIIGLVTALFSVRRILLGAKVPMELQGAYVAVPRTSPVAAAIDSKASEGAESDAAMLSSTG